MVEKSAFEEDSEEEVQIATAQEDRLYFTVIQKLNAHKSGITSVATHPYHDVLLTASLDGECHFYKLDRSTGFYELQAKVLALKDVLCVTHM